LLCRPDEATPEHHVAHGDALARDQLLAADHPYREAGEVVLTASVEARELGRLAAQQRAAGLPAAVGDAAHHGLALVHVQLARGEVVEEEERPRTHGEHVVHAHGHEVDAHRVVAVERERQLELGAHAVRTGHQDGVLDVAR
jgi:hypothetical protein